MIRLIDADKLKKKLDFVYDCAYIGSKSKEGIASDIIEEIDNAPTVEPEITEYDLHCAMTTGYKDGYEMARAKFERPQGECKDCKYFFDTVGRCENCNRNHWYSDNFIRKQI